MTNPRPMQGVFHGAANPVEDGVTHVNVSSQGRTKLGRLLSNFAHTPFTCADGRFASVEGYWYWLGVPAGHPQCERLRTLSGFDAKKLGRQLRAPDWSTAPGFQDKIRAALRAKAAQHPRILELLTECSLPLAHYYVFNGRPKPAGGEWILAEWDRIRWDAQGRE